MQGDDSLKVRKVQLIVDQIDSLPTLPGVAARVLQLASSQDSSARDLTLLIESDQSLTSRILTLVNSPAFRRGKPVGTIDRAVSLLGFEAVRNSVLSLKVFDLFSRKGASAFRSCFDRKAFWKHSLAVAVASQMIARRVRGTGAEEAFVAGLLHDIGKVALDYALPKTFDQVIRRVQVQHRPYVEAEMSILGMDHTGIGKRLAENWKFPASLANVIWLHHQDVEHLPKNIEGDRLVEIVHLADLVARQVRIGLGSPLTDAGDVARMIERLRLPPTFLDSISKDLHRLVAEHVQAMGLEKTDEQLLFCESLQGANAELGLINEQLMAARQSLETRKKHAEVLAALGSEVQRVGRIGELLDAVAAAFGNWLETDVCVAYAYSEDQSYVEGIVKVRGRRQSEQFLFEGRDATGVTPVGGDAAGQYGLTRAEQAQGWLFERLGERLGQGEFYSYPLRSDDAALGGVVFLWPEGRSAPTQTDVQDLSSLAMTASLALLRWQQSSRLTALSESLAEANRATMEAREELVKRRNLASIGAMAAGAAHEINNPLAVISGRAQLLAEVETDEKKVKSLTIIAEQAQRASDIINELMGFARPVTPRLTTVDPAQVVRKAVEQSRTEATEKGVELACEVPADLPSLTADGSQVQWMLEELLQNALYATAAGGQITVRVEADSESGALAMSVVDTGCGMDAATLASASEPFFSGRKAGRGRGLGLAKVQRLAEANKAAMQIESAVNQGTTVRLVFDLAGSASEASSAVEA